MLSIRLKTRQGLQIVQISPQTSPAELRKKIAETTEIPETCLKVLQGYPPKPLDLKGGSEISSDLSLRSGDVLIVEQDTSEAAVVAQHQNDNLLGHQCTAARGILTRKVVPANNSCLFTSVDYAIESRSQVNLDSAKPMRELIASIVGSDPATYSPAILGKSNKSYCKWILSQDAWGGAIEISILSRYYSVEIDVVDTQSGRIDRFGEDQNYAQRILVIYDGIHYDPLVLESLDPTAQSWSTIFSTSDDGILFQAQEIAQEAKSSRQFTDVGSFTLRCLVCNTNLKGQTEAQAHAQSTGHINFGEF